MRKLNFKNTILRFRLKEPEKALPENCNFKNTILRFRQASDEDRRVLTQLFQKYYIKI